MLPTLTLHEEKMSMVSDSRKSGIRKEISLSFWPFDLLKVDFMLLPPIVVNYTVQLAAKLMMMTTAPLRAIYNQHYEQATHHKFSNLNMYVV
jgi:hypothetical protein